MQRLAGQARQELRRFSHIFFRAPDAPARARARTRLAEIRRELADGVAFEELATKYSDSITAGAADAWSGRPAPRCTTRWAEAVYALSEGQSESGGDGDGPALFRLDGIRKPWRPTSRWCGRT